MKKFEIKFILGILKKSNFTKNNFLKSQNKNIFNFFKKPNPETQQQTNQNINENKENQQSENQSNTQTSETTETPPTASILSIPEAAKYVENKVK